MQITTQTGPSGGVWYYLDFDGAHDAVAVLASPDASEEEKSAAREFLKDKPRVLLKPLTNAEYSRERSRSTILQTAFKTQGKGRKATMVLQQDVATQEREFARVLLINHVSRVLGITAKDGPTGEVKEVTTIEELLTVIDSSSSEEAAGIVDELHDALRDSAVLEHGLGEA